jgi:hypothetical protein
MSPVSYDLTISAARADVLFASALQRSDEPGTGQIRRAIAAAIAAYDVSGCAARVAQGFGDHPETPVLRMRWARTMVAARGPRSTYRSGNDLESFRLSRHAHGHTGAEPEAQPKQESWNPARPERRG